MRQLSGTARNLNMLSMTRTTSTPSPISPALSTLVTNSIREESNDKKSSSSGSEDEGFSEDGGENMKFSCEIVSKQSSQKVVAPKDVGDW